MHRREIVAALAGAFASPLSRRASESLLSHPSRPDFAAIERRVKGRLGVAVSDTAAQRHLEYRATERFPMCSTFKWLLGAQVLSRVASNQEHLEHVLHYTERDLLDHAPVTRAHVGEGGMSVADLAAAAIQVSDNTAANLLLNSVGGPASLTAFLRQVGDQFTRLDRMEPELNSAVPGDARDTTTPAAMVADMQKLLVGDGLDAASRDRLLTWMIGTTTGAARLRAGFPSAWKIGDKTGTGSNGSTNDVAIVWPTDGKPILVAAYLTDTTASDAARDNALAEVGRQVARWSEGSR